MLANHVHATHRENACSSLHYSWNTLKNSQCKAFPLEVSHIPRDISSQSHLLVNPASYMYYSRPYFKRTRLHRVKKLQPWQPAWNTNYPTQTTTRTSNYQSEVNNVSGRATFELYYANDVRHARRGDICQNLFPVGVAVHWEFIVVHVPLKCSRGALKARLHVSRK